MALMLKLASLLKFAKMGVLIFVIIFSELLSLGKIKIRVDYTPGHTIESSCFVLLTQTGKEFW